MWLLLRPLLWDWAAARNQRDELMSWSSERWSILPEAQ
jgi:hypothetical protein